MTQEQQEQFFIDNKYLKKYLAIIEDSKNRPRPKKYEKHHIIPKSFGGSDSEDNYAYLTLREHFLVHRILVKIAKGQYYKHKMAFALNRMRNSKRYDDIITSRMYETVRKEHSEAMSDKNNPSYTDGRSVNARKDPKIKASYDKGRYDNMPPEEKEKYLEERREASRARRAKMTPEERKSSDKERNDKKWAKMTPEKKEERNRKQRVKRAKNKKETGYAHGHSYAKKKVKKIDKQRAKMIVEKNADRTAFFESWQEALWSST